MLTPYQTIQECNKTTSTIEKSTTLSNNGSELLKSIINYALDPFKVYGVKKYEFDRPLQAVENFSDGVMVHMFDVLNKLMKREVTGDAARELIKSFSGKLSEQEQDIFARILDKDLKCGVAEGIVNKVFRKLVPEFEVQLANPPKHKDKIIYPCIVQPKMDGVRTIALVEPKENSVVYYSRNGKEFKNFKCFDNELLMLSNKEPKMFDGEVIGPRGDDFRGIMQQCRRKYDVEPKGLNFHVFDWMPMHHFTRQSATLLQKDRSDALVELGCSYKTERVVIVSSMICNNYEEVINVFNEAIDNGYEGIIAKDINGEYDFKRSNAWIKIKPTETEDLKIVDIQEGRGKYKGLLGAIIVDRQGVKINVGSGFKDDDRYELGKAQSLIGKVAEVNFDSVTNDGSLRFPRLVQIREDK